MESMIPQGSPEVPAGGSTERDVAQETSAQREGKKGKHGSPGPWPSGAQLPTSHPQTALVRKRGAF